MTELSSTLYATLLASVALTSLGCSPPEPNASKGAHAAPLSTHQHAIVRPDGDAVVLAIRDGERVIATPEPVREGTDALRTLTLQNPPKGLGLERGDRVLDLQWVEQGVVALGADQVLRHHSRERVVELDRSVLGPLSVAPDTVAYVQGEPPDLFLKITTISSGATAKVDGPSPAWSPALSEDGREVIFVATYEGRPHFFLRGADGEVVTLPTGQRTPSAAVAPIWRDGDLFFQDERGVVRLDLETSSIESQYDGAKLVPYDGTPQVSIEEGGVERVIATWEGTMGGER